MTLREFIKDISAVKPELMDKEIFIQTENGLLMTPRLKFARDLKTSNFLDVTSESVQKIIITE